MWMANTNCRNFYHLKRGEGSASRTRKGCFSWAESEPRAVVLTPGCILESPGKFSKTQMPVSHPILSDLVGLKVVWAWGQAWVNHVFRCWYIWGSVILCICWQMKAIVQPCHCLKLVPGSAVRIFWDHVKIQILRLWSRSTESEFLGLETSILYFNKPSRSFWSMSEFVSHLNLSPDLATQSVVHRLVASVSPGAR